jgi:DNA primase
LFADYERILVIGDGDTAGREFARTVCSKVEMAVPVQMKDGLDVNDLYLLEGIDAIEKLVA